MRKSVGLYTEIVVTMSLLLVAALLLTGFLLVRLTEQELVEQRVAGVVATTQLLARSFFAGVRHQSPEPFSLSRRAEELSSLLTTVPALQSWGLVDRSLNPQSLPMAKGGFEFDLAELNRVRESGEDAVTVHFPSTWIPFQSPQPAFVRVSSAITTQGQFQGALQGQFSLEDVRLRVQGAQRLVYFYTLIYGLILMLFGAYLLNRTVGLPVRRLKTGTAQVAAGNFDQDLPLSGPREIRDVAASFNQMLTALKQSRQQAQESIASLRVANDELRSTRDELIRTEKLASVGQLAAGMAHEVGNPLGATIGYLELLKSELDPGRLKGLAEHALAETERIDRLVRDLLDYAAPSAGAPEPVDLAQLMRETLDLLTHQGVFKKQECRTHIDASLCCAALPRHRLQQVMVNLLLNARDASPDGGAITLEGGEQGGWVWLSVADQGQGIPAELRDRLFDPFFTTKAPGAGRGLGLSICQRIIHDAGGRIDFDAVEGQGARFTVRLPKTRVADG